MSLLEVKGLSKSFGSSLILDNVNLNVEEGERIAIIGASGCGKSVFLRCLELLEQPTAGTIVIDGEEITAKNANVDQIRRKMGMVYQKFYLFEHMNVMDNLCLAPVRLLGMPREEAEKKAMDLLEQVGLAARAYRFPQNLSGGQQQRVAICRSLMMEPKLLLLDEPTSALDPSMVGEVLAVIRMLAKRHMTMMIVTHEMTFAKEFASRVLFFADKGIYEQGTPQEIFSEPKKEKTISFIRKTKQLIYDIHEKKFDLMEMQGRIFTFCEKYGIDRMRGYRLQLCCEELIYEMMAQCYQDSDLVEVHLEVEFSEVDQVAEIQLYCGGTEYDPFAEEDEGLGVTILKKMATFREYKYENHRNELIIRI